MEETIGQKLQRLARESLPRPRRPEMKDRNSKRRCICGDFLPANPKTRQKQKVCDVCAETLPRLLSGKRSSCSCVECHTIYPRLKLKVKNDNLYCKKCLKLKFNIDF
jgi:hypothetical protein